MFSGPSNRGRFGEGHLPVSAGHTAGMIRMMIEQDGIDLLRAVSDRTDALEHPTHRRSEPIGGARVDQTQLFTRINEEGIDGSLDRRSLRLERTGDEDLKLILTHSREMSGVQINVAVVNGCDRIVA